MRRLLVSSWRHRPIGRRVHGGPRAAFTLIELLVVVVILTILASLSLAGLVGARQRAKADKTRSTIRKIDAVIRPMYDSYRTRRVNTSAISAPTASQCNRCFQGGSLQASLGNGWKRLVGLRSIAAAEMPDCWPDAATNTVYSKASTAAQRAGNGESESLYLILARSGFEPDALESFRNDEIGDADSDSAYEFIDGWGNPIIFLRWAPGFTSLIQTANADTAHDPWDTLRVDFTPSNVAATGYALVPLVVSNGPDGTHGLTLGPSSGWLTVAPLSTLARSNGSALIGAPDSSTPTAYVDNITNHDLSKK